MALFSRRDKGDDRTPAPVTAAEVADEALEGGASQGATAAEVTAPSEPVPHVGISVSTFGQGAESARPVEAPAPEPARTPRPPATAPAPTQTLPGVPDNTLLQAALRALPEKPQSADVMNVMRQALQGPLYARAQGDAQALIAAGEGLNLAITTHEDKRFLLVFSGGTQVQASARAEAAEGAEGTSAIGQPAHVILRTAVDSGYDGVYFDHADEGARLVVPIELVTKALDEGAPAPFELKNLLAAERSDATPAAIAEALTRVPVWVAAGMDAAGQVGLAEARGEGRRLLEIYSHPLEVIVMGRGDRPLPLTPEQFAKTLASTAELTGVVVDAGGPWIELDRATLAPVFALAG